MKTQLLNISFLLFFVTAFSQENNSALFSLQQAIDYAYKNSPNYLNAQNDVLMAKYKRKEVLGIAMPQINASVDMKNFLEIPTNVLPNFVAPAVYGGLLAAGAAPYDASKLDANSYEPIAAQFGTRYQATAGANASLLVFSADYLVGLKITKDMINLMNIQVTRSKAETVLQVSKAYYLYLITTERVKGLDANITKLKKLLSDTKETNKQGFVEQLDVDRLEVAYNNLITERSKLDATISLLEKALKFQMGYSGKEKITLTDSLNLIDKEEIEIANINTNNRPEILATQTFQKINATNIKRIKFGYLPSLVAFGAFNYSGMRNDLKYFTPQHTWYPTALIGATLSLNLFDGMQRHYKIQQAKLEFKKGELNLKQLQLASELESTSAASNYNNALASLKTQKRNLELSQNILSVSQKKYEQGVGSNIEILSAQTALRESEINYYSAIYDVLFNKLDYLKATGTLVK